MILIVGGAFQGKRAYALETLAMPEARVVDALEAEIRGWLVAGRDPLREAERLLPSWRDAAVILADIGCGIVPMDPLDRAWREAVGRVGAYLARNAERVVRVFCGIGMDIPRA